MLDDRMDNIVFLLVFATGFGFQTVLPGSLRRFLIYPLAFVLGFLTHTLDNFLLLAFGLGMTARAVVGGYWMCVALELGCLLSGLLVSFFI